MEIPSTVLLVPAEGDPHGLLADGACGARVPTMRQCDGRPEWLEPADAPTPYDTTRALVLAYRGKAVPEGCDRANRALIAATEGAVGAVRDAYDLAYVLRRWPMLTAELGGRVVLLDADGREVNDAH